MRFPEPDIGQFLLVATIALSVIAVGYFLGRAVMK
jgi:hypothetical protein